MIMPPQFEVRGIQVELSAEQVTTMQDIARGMNYQEVAEVECISHPAVKKRVKAVCNALGAENRTVALCLLLEAGVIR